MTRNLGQERGIAGIGVGGRTRRSAPALTLSGKPDIPLPQAREGAIVRGGGRSWIGSIEFGSG